MRWNLGFPATVTVIFIGTLRRKKRSTEKKTPWERLPRGDRSRPIRMFTHLRYRSWRGSIPLRDVLRQRKQGYFEQDLSRFLRCNFLRFAGPSNIFVPFQCLLIKKIHKTKFEVEEENTKFQIARTMSLLPLFYFFSAFK